MNMTIMKKQLFFAAVASITLFSCTSDDIAGGNPNAPSQGTEDAITFGSTFKAVTRAEGAAAANLLGNQFKVYGVKQNSTTTTNYDKVFVDYIVKYDDTKVGNTDYNYGWYYVGAETNQYIKYWDYKSADYHFVAGSPVNNFTFNLDATTGNITTATVTGLGGRLNNTTSVGSNHAAVYVADPKVVEKANYNSEVEFSFHALLSKVRVGIYETIPGYKISSITFYNNDNTPVGSNYITLNSATDNYFQGGSANVGSTITYDWTNTPASYTFEYTGTGLTKAKYWEGGKYETGVPATTSTATDLYGVDSNKDGKGYFIVLPTAAATGTALTLKCEYTLQSLDNSGEEIVVDNATATIPAEYTKWLPNYAYTYLFKITDSNLHPITFDAVVVETIDQGTTTTVSAPSITVYQDGDVVTSGITYKAGDVEVKAMYGTTDVTSSATWKYVVLNGTSFDYSKDYEHLGDAGAGTTWTTISNPSAFSVSANKTYIIKAVYTDTSDNKTYTAYFVLVVGAAETGPNN